MADQAEKDICFVVSPIGQAGSPERRHADWVFKGIIKPVFDAHYPDFKVERADQITEPGQINTQVIDRLLNSRVVVADLSFLNANVFYEVGIRHMVEKPIIHMQRVDEAIPFDVSIYRAIKFSLAEYEHFEVAKALLTTMVADVLKPDYVPNNPVIEARGRAKLSETATPPERIVIEDMAQMKARIAALEAMVERSPTLNYADFLARNIDRPTITSDWIRNRSLAELGKKYTILGSPEFSMIEVDRSKLSDNDYGRVIEIIKNFRGDEGPIGFVLNGNNIQLSGRLTDLDALAAMLSEFKGLTVRLT